MKSFLGKSSSSKQKEWKQEKLKTSDWVGGEDGGQGEGERAERRAVGMDKKEDEMRYQKKEHDWVTNWIQMITEIGDLNFSFWRCKTKVG